MFCWIKTLDSPFKSCPRYQQNKSMYDIFFPLGHLGIGPSVNCHERVCYLRSFSQPVQRATRSRARTTALTS